MLSVNRRHLSYFSVRPLNELANVKWPLCHNVDDDVKREICFNNSVISGVIARQRVLQKMLHYNHSSHCALCIPYFIRMLLGYLINHVTYCYLLLSLGVRRGSGVIFKENISRIFNGTTECWYKTRMSRETTVNRIVSASMGLMVLTNIKNSYTL